ARERAVEFGRLCGSSEVLELGAEAIHHATHRKAFGTARIDQPVMANVLADLAIESEAAAASVMRLARAYDDAAAGDREAALFERIATPVLKYWICKRAPWHAAESLECLGGNGYAEESGMPRLFRESPLMSIWEGSGNVQCLDAIRAMVREPDSVEIFFDEVGEATGSDSKLDEFTDKLKAELTDDPETLESRARRSVERMALALQGSLLTRHGDPAIAQAFSSSRLGDDHGGAFGTLPAETDFQAIIERNAPVA
ncbi:MAG: acyl-CoA dehydrogenase family protein, partial [Solirubrobacterales bacterium]